MDLVIPFDSDRPTRAEIRLGALRRNMARIRELAGSARVMAVVKADAYGHGLLRMAREFTASGADCLGVALVEEGVYLRRNGIVAPILVLGPLSVSQADRFIEHDLELTIPSLEKARAVSAAAVALGGVARIHLKFDTGMGRIGAQWDRDPGGFAREVFALPGLEVAGVFSHFSSADSDQAYSAEQERRFGIVLEAVRREARRDFPAHLANSAGLAARPGSRLDMVRVGIALYGYEPVPGISLGVEPVMRFMSKVAYFKMLGAGSRISYGGRYTLETGSRVVTVPVGYADGYPRALGNRGRALVRGASRPVAGTVCMDQLMLDLGPDGEAWNGDDVLLFGTKGSESVPLEELCSILDTIPYELVCRVSSRVPRVYVED